MDFADYVSLLQNDIPVLLLLICHSVSSLILHELTNHRKSWIKKHMIFSDVKRIFENYNYS